MFGFHPVNLGFRFGLELLALVSLGAGAYQLSSGWLAWLIAISLPVFAAVVWGTFNVPGDRSRSGAAPVPVPGLARLILELAVFASAVLLIAPVSSTAALVLGTLVLAHYALSLDRVHWLITG